MILTPTPAPHFLPGVHGRKGGGKGGGKSKSARESKDTLRSKQIARILDAYSWGQTGGLYDGKKSVFLDGDTPLMNADGGLNFQGIEIDERLGLPDQTHVAGFSAVEAEVAVNVQVTQNSPVIRTIIEDDVDAVRVKIRIPRLMSIDSSGDVIGTHVEYAIDRRRPGGNWEQLVFRHVVGKASSPWEIEYRIDRPAGGAPWDVRVRRPYVDSTSARIENDTWFSSYTKVIDAKLSYPNLAYIAIEADAEEFGDRIPNRSYDVRGILIQVPRNYDPDTRTYATTGPGTSGGLWDGTFWRKSSDNPAWIVYDMLTENRYGLGDYLGTLIPDKFSFYEVAQYCDALVPDGKGGFEPRFTCNVWISTRTQGLDLIRALLSGCWASLVAGGGGVSVVQDRPADAVALMGPANVIDGVFNYEGPALSARHTVAMVTWNDPENGWRPTIAVHEDPDLIQRYGWRPLDTTLLGCTSEGQALRHARWMLETEKAGVDTVSFATGLENADVGPGAIAKVGDPAYAGVRFEGKLLDANDHQVILDAAVTLEFGQPYYLTVVLPDKTLETREIITGAGAQTALEVSPAFSAAPVRNAMWLVSTPAVEPRQFRIIGVREREPHIFEMSGLLHDPDKYARIENNLTLPSKNFSIVPTGPMKQPTSLTIEEFLYESGTSILNGVIIGWTPPGDSRVIYYEVQAAEPGSDDYFQVDIIKDPSAIMRDLALGIWSFRVRGLDALGVASPWTSATKELLGKTARPAPVDGFAVTASGTTAHATWNRHPDLDVRVGGYIAIRHTPLFGAVEWENCLPVGEIPGGGTVGELPLLPGSYLAKAVDSSGNESQIAVKSEISAAGVIGFNAVATLIEDPAFTGVKTGLVAADGVLKLAGAGLWDDIPDVDAVPDIDSYGGIATSGTYEFSTYVDVGAVYENVIITVQMAVSSFAIGFTVDSRPGTVDEWTSWDGAVPGAASAALFISITEDDPGGSPVWSDWQPFVPGAYRGRGFRFKLELSTTLADQNVSVSLLRALVDMPDRVESFYGLVSDASALKHVTYSQPFFEEPSTVVTPIAMLADEKLVVTNETIAGYDMEILNGSGVRQVRAFNSVSTGFGKKVL